VQKCRNETARKQYGRGYTTILFIEKKKEAAKQQSSKAAWITATSDFNTLSYYFN
jgi:hypothetical protein